jgi:DnaJ-class molecular chaperone
MSEIFSPDAYDSDLLNDGLTYSNELEVDHSFSLSISLHDAQNNGEDHSYDPDFTNSWNLESNYHTKPDNKHFDRNEDIDNHHDDSLVKQPHSEDHFGAAGSCSLCHGTGSYWSAPDRQQVKCIRCGGSGIG